MTDYNRIQPWLLVGAFLESAHEVETLQQREGITAVLNLQTDEDIEEFGSFAGPPESLMRPGGSNYTEYQSGILTN